VHQTVWCAMQSKAPTVDSMVDGVVDGKKSLIVHCPVRTRQSGAHADMKAVELPNGAP
jgi:hypothetical protein